MNHARERGVTIVAVLAALGVVALMVGVGMRGVAAQEGSAVSIVDFAFQPGALEVPVGTTVTWTNTGAAPHTVTADDGAFNSGELAPGATFSQTFDAAGTFAYHCEIHPDMTASVTVTDAAAAPAETPAAPAETPAAAAAQAPAAAETPAAVARVPRTGIGAAAPGQSGALALLAGLAAVIIGAAAIVSRRA
jgi:plastocyanin